jgi:hypothetical protein
MGHGLTFIREATGGCRTFYGSLEDLLMHSVNGWFGFGGKVKEKN